MSISKYRVVVELDSTLYTRGGSFGTDNKGVLRRVDFTRFGRGMAVVFRCGAKLRGLAEIEAAATGGDVETYCKPVGDYL